MTRKIPLFVGVAVLVVLILSAYSIHKRTQVEAENRSVAIAAEYESLEALAASQGISVRSALTDSKAQGLRAVVLSEQSVGELLSSGRAAFTVGEPSLPASNRLNLTFSDSRLIPQVQRGLRIRFGNLAGSLQVSGAVLQLPPVSPQLIRSTPIGLNPNQIANVNESGLEIIARGSNSGGESASAIRDTLAWLHEQGAAIFLPQGDEVLGYRNALDQTIDDLRADGMLYASAEFAKIAGDERIVEKGQDIVVRLHAAQSGELDKLTPIDALDRYVKAARERNMRVLLLRPISVAGPQPYFEFNEFIHDVAAQLARNGMAMGRPHALREPGLPKVFFPLLGLSIAPVVWFVASCFVTDRRWRIAGAVLLFLAGIACYGKLGQELMALLGSMAFPVLGFLVLDQTIPRFKNSEFLRIAVGFWTVSAISIMGGICVSGMLNSLAFYIRASEFQAVKLSVFLPIVVVGCHYFLRLTNWRGALKSPMTWGGTALGLLLGLVLALMIARTGNDTGVGPSGGEMVFRNLLDRFLYVRPRTKEFLVGHPFLVLGIALLGRVTLANRREAGSEETSATAGWTVLALMVGAIGQTSIVNTLCHIHIPFYLSLVRDIEGLVIGFVLGLLLWLVTRPWLPKAE